MAGFWRQLKNIDCVHFVFESVDTVIAYDRSISWYPSFWFISKVKVILLISSTHVFHPVKLFSSSMVIFYRLCCIINWCFFNSEHFVSKWKFLCFFIYSQTKNYSDTRYHFLFLGAGHYPASNFAFKRRLLAQTQPRRLS